MTIHCDSRDYLELMRSMAILITIAIINMGTWNVRTMSETGNTSKTAAEIRRYNQVVHGISETYRNQAGQQRLITGDVAALWS